MEDSFNHNSDLDGNLEVSHAELKIDANICEPVGKAAGLEKMKKPEDDEMYNRK